MDTANLTRTTLEELIDKVIDYRGKTPKKLKGNWSSTGIPALSAKNIKGGKIVNEESIRYVDLKLYSRWMKEELQKEDILITSEAPLGETYFIKKDIKICLSQRLFAVRVNKQKIDPKFLYYYFNSELGKHELQSRATGTTVGGIRQTALMNVVVYHPESTVTQSHIASIITTYDDLIENNEKRIKTLEEMAQCLYTEWFVKFKFPGHEKVRMIDSGTEYGLIPEGWEIRKIEDLYQTASGGTPSRSKFDEYYINGTINWIKTKELNNQYILETEERITEQAIKKSAAKIFPKNSVVIAMYGATIGKLGILSKEAATNQACCVFLLKDSYLSNFYVFHF